VDALRWDEQDNKRFLDFDAQQCLRVCAGASVGLGDCAAECLADSSSGSRAQNGLAGAPYSRPCAGCLGEWAACLRETCRCDSRRDSQACAQCAQAECEPRVLECSGFKALPPPGSVGDAPDKGAGLSNAVIGGAAAGGLLVALAALLAVRRSRRRTARGAGARGDMTPSMRESPNPVFAPPPAGAATRFGNVTVSFPFKAASHGELSCTSGEGLQLVRRIDSEWALCVNERGEQGIVPLNSIARGGPAHE
jgi:hypothetical protein